MSDLPRIRIDPNVRVRGRQVFAGLEDVEGVIAVGRQVEIYEPESALSGPATVADIDFETQLVYLDVDWEKVVILNNPCPCGRMDRGMSWLCQLCYMQKEIGYALDELERGGDAWEGRSWYQAGLERLEKLTRLGSRG